MRIRVLIILASLAIISGCRDTSGIRGYWSSRDLDLENVAAAEDQFTDFVELAVKAPEKDARAAIDHLLKKAGRDTVTYLVYADWIARGFSTLASPCRNCGLFVYAADKILSKGILDGYSAEDFRQRREFCLYNRVGDKIELPETMDDDGIASLDGRTLFLVVDQDCPTCRESLQKFLSPKWEGTALTALCYGHGPLPSVDRWECRRISGEQTIIDTRQAPFYFVAAPDGTIEITYTSVYNESI